MASTSIFAPVVRSVQPAFILGGVVRIYFSFSAYDTIIEGRAIYYSLIDPNIASTWGTNNKLTDGAFNNKCQAYVKSAAIQPDNEINEKYIEIDTESLNLTVNQYYQVQLWAYQGDEVSAPSQITLIRPINAPTFSFDGAQVDEDENIIINIYNFTKLSGSVQGAELLDSCYIEIFTSADDPEKIGESFVKKINGRFFEINRSEIKFSDNSFQSGSSYTINFHYTTINGYNSTQIINLEYKSYELNEEISMPTIDFSSALGAIILTNIPSNTILQRYDIESKYWKDLKSVSTATSYADIAVEGGLSYKYRLIQANEVSQESDEFSVDFDDIFLSDEKHLFAVRFNPNISNFKYVTQESITNTLGGKFPIVRQNGDTRYRQFSLSGLIYINDDATPASAQDSSNKLYNVNNEYVNVLLVNNEKADFDYLKNFPFTNLRQKEYREKAYRDIIINFLTNGSPKLFRSFEEGNMIVYLSGISFTPNKTCGRHLYDFSATVTEICEYTDENLNKYKLIADSYTDVISLKGGNQ